MTIYQELKQEFPGLKFHCIRRRKGPFYTHDLGFEIQLWVGRYWVHSIKVTPEIRYIDRSVFIIFLRDHIKAELKKNYNV